VAESADVLRNGPGDGWWHNDAGEPITRASRDQQLQSLIDILDRAVAAQPEADAVVAACGEAEPVSRRLARAGARLQVTFHRLLGQLEALDLDADLEPARESAGSLLAYHQRMLREALAVAFRVRSLTRAGGDWPARINGLGAPANRLRDLRDNIHAMGGPKIHSTGR
jgi:hypothetical protein